MLQACRDRGGRLNFVTAWSARNVSRTMIGVVPDPGAYYAVVICHSGGRANMKGELRDSIESETKPGDCKTLVKLMEQESGYKASFHGKIVEFGLYHYTYGSGREGGAIVTGFSLRSQEISIYIMPGFSDCSVELAALGAHKTSKSCLYVKRLSDVEEGILRKIVKDSVQFMRARYECTDA
jgi:hypothetical protein